MSAKSAKRSKVSVNRISSNEESDSDLNSNEINEDFDDINALNESESDAAEEMETGLGSGSGSLANNTSWADAINKVLSVKPKNKSFILSKAKKDKDLKPKNSEQKDSLEIIRSDGTADTSDQKNSKIEKKDKNKNKLKKNEWDLMNRLKPKTEDREKERMLCSIATKGVVQLFNAVREQQKTIDTKINEIGKSETKRDKMLTQFNKKQFLDKLKQNQTSNKDNKTEETNVSDKTQSEDQKWKVLRDDFMIGAKMKDWDKLSDSDDD